MITRCFDQDADADSQNKNNMAKETGHSKALRAAVHAVGDGAIYSRESQAAVNEKSGRLTEPLQITEV